VAFQAKPKVYDLLILGSGAGLKLLGWTFVGCGQRVGAQFTHIYEDDFRVVRENILCGNLVTSAWNAREGGLSNAAWVIERIECEFSPSVPN